MTVLASATGIGVEVYSFSIGRSGHLSVSIDINGGNKESKSNVAIVTGLGKQFGVHRRKVWFTCVCVCVRVCVRARACF